MTQIAAARARRYMMQIAAAIQTVAPGKNPFSKPI